MSLVQKVIREWKLVNKFFYAASVTSHSPDYDLRVAIEDGIFPDDFPDAV